jgi:hypothetical protein
MLVLKKLIHRSMLRIKLEVLIDIFATKPDTETPTNSSSQAATSADAETKDPHRHTYKRPVEDMK